MKLREFRQEDSAAVASLWRLVFPDAPSHNLPEEDIRRKLFVQPELFIVAEEEGRVVGTTMAGYDGHRGWIYYVVVHPDFRRRGLGQALMAEAESRLKVLGCSKVNLQVRAGNHAAVDFYRNLGYDIEDRVSMGRLLAGPDKGVKG